MQSESDPLAVLLATRDDLCLGVDKELIRQCYQLQSAHQYDKDRVTVSKMKALIEEKVVQLEAESLL